MKTIKTLTPLLFATTTACGISIDGDFSFDVAIASETATYSDSGTVDPCSNEEVRDNADKLSSVSIISVEMLITNVPDAPTNQATTASVTGTLDGVSRTVTDVPIVEGGEPIVFEFTDDELGSFSDSLLSCTPLSWEIRGEADAAPVVFDAVVTVEAEFEADAI